MLIQRPADIPSSEITPESVYLNRRRFMGSLAVGAAAMALDPELLVGAELARPRAPRRQEEKPTPFEAITTYNNFYEFGFQKEDPSRNAHVLRTRPWSVAIEGHVRSPRSTTSRTSSSRTRSRTASTGCAASRRGPW